MGRNLLLVQKSFYGLRKCAFLSVFFLQFNPPEEEIGPAFPLSEFDCGEITNPLPPFFGTLSLTLSLSLSLSLSVSVIFSISHVMNFIFPASLTAGIFLCSVCVCVCV